MLNLNCYSHGLVMKGLFLVILFLLPYLGFSQSQQNVDFLKGQISLKIAVDSKRIDGNVTYSFKVHQKIDSIFIDAQNMQFSRVLLNGKKVRFAYDQKKLAIHKKMKSGKSYEITVVYSCKPEQTVYFLGWEDTIPKNEQIWTQGQGKYSSHWVPSIDDMNEKAEFDISITFDSNYEVIANGNLIFSEVKETMKTWVFDMQNPMSSYLLAFAIGTYKKQETRSSSGIPLYMYYYPEDSLNVEPTYRHTKEIMQVLEEETGTSYPWQNYKQIPVRDFLYAGMENTGTTIFSDAFMVDSTAFFDKNFVNVNAHEMAHQWFGNLVTEVDASDHWLHEGFASYYALLAEKEIFGSDYYFWKLFNMAQNLESLSRNGQGQSLTDPKASSATFYDKGAWALIMLKEQLGAATFKRGIASFLNTFQYQNVTVENFIEIMEASSEQNLDTFKDQWLIATDFPIEETMNYLQASSETIDQFLKLQRELTVSPISNEKIIQRYWSASSSSEFKRRVISLYHKSLSNTFLKEAFLSGDLHVRQALANIPGPVPLELVPEYESLLQDKSYITIESALYKLWIYLPQDRSKYLMMTKDLVGFSNKNIRQLWLLLAILTKDFEDENAKARYKEELLAYTSPYYNTEVRQIAFSLIGEVLSYSDQNLKDLVNAAVHPAWQFRSYARRVLDGLVKNEVQRKRLALLVKDLKGEELEYLNKIVLE